MEFLRSQRHRRRRTVQATGECHAGDHCSTGLFVQFHGILLDRGRGRKKERKLCFVVLVNRLQWYIWCAVKGWCLLLVLSLPVVACACVCFEVRWPGVQKSKIKRGKDLPSTKWEHMLAINVVDRVESRRTINTIIRDSTEKNSKSLATNFAKILNFSYSTLYLDDNN